MRASPPCLDVDEYSGYRWFASLAQRLEAVECAPLGKPRSGRLIDARADDIPVFDTGEFTFNFAQLFRTDRFSSADRVGHANQATSALTSRLLSSGNGEEIHRASVDQIVFFRDRETEFPSLRP